MPKSFANMLIILALLVSSSGHADVASNLSRYQRSLRVAGEDMLENLEVSYVYGGNKVGDEKTCDQCNRCLELNRPSPKERFKICQICGGCSLDCSHFVQLVFSKAELGFPYITSTQMADLDESALVKKYHLRPVSRHSDGLLEGDLLVYHGHVVIVEKVHSMDAVDIIHATGGKDIRVPGQGIQRERFIRVTSFRGDLLRVLRHVRIDELWRKKGAVDMSASSTASAHATLPDGEQRGAISERSPAPRRFKMRRVEKRQSDAALR